MSDLVTTAGFECPHCHRVCCWACHAHDDTIQEVKSCGGWPCDDCVEKGFGVPDLGANVKQVREYLRKKVYQSDLCRHQLARLPFQVENVIDGHPRSGSLVTARTGSIGGTFLDIEEWTRDYFDPVGWYQNPEAGITGLDATAVAKLAVIIERFIKGTSSC